MANVYDTYRMKLSFVSYYYVTQKEKQQQHNSYDIGKQRNPSYIKMS